jgi:exopolysaccharide biosynthesis WecB/TagA/CpsF family protein
LVRIVECDDKIKHLYDASTFLLFDSRFVSLIARAIGLETPSVVTGSDLTAALFERVIDANTHICIVGCNAASVERLRERFGLGAVEHICPPMGFINNPAEVEMIVAFVAAARADYTFLAVGSPQQEIIAKRLSERSARGVGLCIGASIEFLAGDVRRAPKIMQTLGIEWLFRFLYEPRRLFRRYFIECPKIFGILLRARFGRGKEARRTQPVLK